MRRKVAYRSMALPLCAMLTSLFMGMGWAQNGRSTRVVVHEGTVIPVRMDTSLSSGKNRIGDKFSATVLAEFPSGTKIEGTVHDVERADKNRPGMLDLDFRTVKLSDGQDYRLDGSLISLDDKNITRTSDGRLMAKNRRSKDRMKFIGYGAGAGFLIGMLTKHTLTGTLLGAAAGYIYSEVHKDKGVRSADVTLKSGTEFGVRLDRELAYDTNRGYASTRQGQSGSYRRTGYSSSRGAIGVTMDGRPISLRTSSSRPFEESGNVLVPLDPIMDEAGIQYRYDDRRRTVRVDTGEGELFLKIGKPYALMDGERENLETSAQVRDGEVFVPLRFLALATGMRVIWDTETGTVVMTSTTRAQR